MTTDRKLEFLLRAIVTAGGPNQTADMSDEIYLLAVTYWLLRIMAVGHAASTIAEGNCGCQKP